jgi:hypothetical protein
MKGEIVNGRVVNITYTLFRAFLGSVSRHFATNAECPVLIVPQHTGK